MLGAVGGSGPERALERRQEPRAEAHVAEPRGKALRLLLHRTFGLHADVLPVLKQNDVAILGWDMLDASPTGYEVFDNPPAPGGAVHVIGIVYMGLPLLDNACLEPLAAACAEEGRWEFLLTINPLHIRGGTGSPVNPVAIF